MKKSLLILSCLFAFYGNSQTISIQTFASNFTNPVEIVHAGDTRLFVVEQDGLIKILNSNGVTNTTPFLNLSSIISIGGERGLLGLAFHPNYATNGLFFVNYTNTSGNTVIARYSVNSSNPSIANTTGTILMTISQPYSNHNGGSLKFGADGYLYIGMGDGGSGGDPQGYAQNLTVSATNPTRVFLGKMLRIDVNSGTTYGIPPTNPFVGQAGKQEIWAYGVRNPWKFSFNRLNGDLWIADVGQNNVEEINKISSPLPNTGLNFGWRCYEGSVAYNTAGCAAIGTMTMPVAQYTHSGTGGCSITGGYFYTGSVYPNFQNKYFFADYCVNRIGYVNSSNVITYSTTFSGDNYFTTFGEDVSGELYVAGSATGTIYKIIDSSLATSEFEKNGFSLYPNPAKNILYLKSSTTDFASKIEILDLSGKLLLSKNLDANPENTIAVDVLSKGMYLVTIESVNKKQFTTKLVVE